ncbi:MAG: hypothetical protein K9K63_05245 [Desulfotignum sp.]|nr:hypothetical protein [Desulfotignum sp.]MCF8136699.1 hypothetical protein [Desulfotignum sp.]
MTASVFKIGILIFLLGLNAECRTPEAFRRDVDAGAQPPTPAPRDIKSCLGDPNLLKDCVYIYRLGRYIGQQIFHFPVMAVLNGMNKQIFSFLEASYVQNITG